LEKKLIREELEAITKTKQKKNESTSKYVYRLVYTFDTMYNEKIRNLSIEDINKIVKDFEINCKLEEGALFIDYISDIISKVDNSIWKSLSNNTKIFVNTVIKLINENKILDIPLFPDEEIKIEKPKRRKKNGHE
jgi:alcohol dehydrogenase YqhD (iron-dependent ADH family)